MTNWSEVRGWLQLAITVGTALWAFVVTRHRAHISQLAALEAKQAAMHERLALAEQALRHVPSLADVRVLSAQLEALNERLDGFGLTLNRMDDFLRRDKS